MKLFTIVLSLLFICWFSYSCYEKYNDYKRGYEPIYHCYHFETIYNKTLDPNIKLIQHPNNVYPANTSGNMYLMACYHRSTFREWNKDKDYETKQYSHDVYIYKQDNPLHSYKITITTTQFIKDFILDSERFNINKINQYIVSLLISTIHNCIYLFKN